MPPTTGRADDYDQLSELQGMALPSSRRARTGLPCGMAAAWPVCADPAPPWCPSPSSEDSTRHVHLRVTPPAPPARTVLAEPVPSERTSHHGYPREQARTATIR